MSPLTFHIRKYEPWFTLLDRRLVARGILTKPLMRR